MSGAGGDARRLRHWQDGLPPHVETLRKTLCALDSRQAAINKARRMVENGGVIGQGFIDGHIAVWLNEADLTRVIMLIEDTLRAYYLGEQEQAASNDLGPE